ncbi:MAG: IS4 family transposase [Ignavibacteriaceae bacterium]
MSKDNEIKFVGQPIFGQIMKLIDKSTFVQLVRDKKSDYYYKAFRSWDQLTVMLFGILSRCDSMSEICEGMKALGGKLNHLGMEKAPAKSTASDGLRNRDSSFFEALYYKLVEQYKGFLSDSRTFGLTFKELLIIDSTTIRLFSDILKGVGRNPKNDGKKKGGLKVHMLIDAVQSVAKFVRITEAKVHDKNFLTQIIAPAHSMLVFDRAYNYYKQFAKWSEQMIYFVTRQKKNAVCEILEIIQDKILPKGTFGVYKEEIIEVTYKENKEEKTVKLRRIYYIDEKMRQFVFITNNFDITAEEVAFIYKKRWQIELLFKKMKQNFQLHYFYGENENAIRTQVWCTLIAQLLLTVLQKIADVKKAFSTIATLVRIHLISLLDVYELLRNVKRTYSKQKADVLTPSLFPV